MVIITSGEKSEVSPEYRIHEFWQKNEDHNIWTFIKKGRAKMALPNYDKRLP
jgi:hypothetical protein